ncbi:CFEM domain-containing protein [Phyllosticta paracitricarpa]
MKTAVAAIALSMVSVAYSQAVTDLPNCAVNCFVQVLSNDGCSSLGDFECHCKKPGLVESVTPCVEKACSVADQESTSLLALPISALHLSARPPISSHANTVAVKGSISFQTILFCGRWHFFCYPP